MDKIICTYVSICYSVATIRKRWRGKSELSRLHLSMYIHRQPYMCMPRQIANAEEGDHHHDGDGGGGGHSRIDQNI